MNNKDIVNQISIKAASELLGTNLYPEEAIKPYSGGSKLREKRPYKIRNPDKIATQREKLKEYGWQKGQSGNPKGRPPNPISLTALLNKKLATHPELADAIVNALIALGRAKDMRAIEMTFERVDGKVVERHEISGELPVRILFVPAEQIIGRKIEGIEPAQKPLRLEEGNS